MLGNAARKEATERLGYFQLPRSGRVADEVFREQRRYRRHLFVQAFLIAAFMLWPLFAIPNGWTGSIIGYMMLGGIVVFRRWAVGPWPELETPRP